MTNEERDLITRFIARAAGAPQAGGFSGSVPASVPALPPVDPEANALIKDMFNRYPEAAYRITQMAFVEEQALVEAQNRIKRLEWELEQAKQQCEQAQAQAAQARPSRGLFGGLFGGGSQSQPPPGQPFQAAPQQPYQQQYQPPPPPPQYGAGGVQPGMVQRSGSGFLGSALTTAAGVAGGMLAADALRGLFSGHQSGFGGGLGGFGGGETIVQDQLAGGGTNPWDTAQNQNDAGWDTAGSPAAPADQGGWDVASNDPGPGPAADQGGWADQSGAPDSGFEDSGGGFEDT
jgi:hypothetical protein